MSSTTYKGPRASAKSSSTSASQRTASGESQTSGKGSSKNDTKTKLGSSKQPDIGKYAKYLQEDKTSKFEESQYKPTIRAERHQMGYATALNQRRNKANAAADPPTTSSEDPGQQRRSSRIHSRSYSLNRGSATYVDGVRQPEFTKRSDAADGDRHRSRQREGFKPRMATGLQADVLEEEWASNLPRTGLSADARNERLSSSFNNLANLASYVNGTSSRSASPSTFDDDCSSARNEATTKANEKTNSSGFDDADVKSFSSRGPNKTFFTTFDEFDGRKTSADHTDRLRSTPKASATDAKLPQEKATPKKSFLSPDSCYSSKYFPSPFETTENHHSRRPETSSCRGSPMRNDPEMEGDTKPSARRSFRNGVFDHLRSQESRRSHSLDSRNRTSDRNSAGDPSPSPQSRSPRRSRVDQMNSLNESNFESKSAFKDHLLNLTMNRDQYDDIMSDFKNGSIIEESDLAKGTGVRQESETEVVVSDKSDDGPAEKGLDMTCESQNAYSSGATVKEDAAPSNSNDQPAKESTKDSVDCTDSTDPREQHQQAAAVDNLEVKNSDEPTDKVNNECDNKIPEVEKESHDENYFQVLTELIKAAREKYSSPDLRQNVECQITLEPVLSEEITHKWRFQKTEFGIPTSMGVTSEGCVVVADYGNSCLEFFNAVGDFEHKIDGIKPFGIAVNKKDNVIVGDRRGKAIRIFDKFGSDVAQWESKTFGWISGIALLQNGNLVICDRDRCKIGIYTECGDNVTEFGSYGANSSQLCMADFLAVDSKDRIIVADSGNHCLKLFDTNGKSIGKVSSRGVKDGCVEWPKGICVDRNDNIIVADMHNNRVSMFAPSGDFVQQLVSMTPNPYNVCHGRESDILGVLHYSLKGFSQYDVYTL